MLLLRCDDNKIEIEFFIPANGVIFMISKSMLMSVREKKVFGNSQIIEDHPFCFYEGLFHIGWIIKLLLYGKTIVGVNGK